MRRPALLIACILLSPLAPAATEPAPGSDGEARALLERMRKAILGGHELREVHTVSAVRISSKMGPVDGRLRMWVTADGRLRQELDLPFGSLLTIWNGRHGAIGDPLKTHEMGAGVEIEVRRTLQRHPLLLAAKLGESVREVSAAGTETVEGHPCRVLVVKTADAAFRLFLDEETSLPRKESYVGVAGVSGPELHIEIYFDDWREVDGVKVPFTERMASEGKPSQLTTQESVEINGGLDPKLFEPSTTPAPAD